MKEQSLNIKSAGAVVNIKSQDSAILDALKDSDFLSKYIPDGELGEGEIVSNDNAILEITIGNENSATLDYPRATYGAPKYNDKDIISLTEYLLERGRQENGDYCIHSSTVLVDGEAVILWGGASGMGKTRLALNLSKRADTEMYSDEKTIINLERGVVMGGVRQVYLSKLFLSQRHDGKRFLEINSSGDGGDIPIKYFIYPYVEESCSGGVIVDMWEPSKFDWHLYEELSRKIRGVSRRLFKNTIPVQSLDTDSIAKRRSRTVSSYVGSGACYFMKGCEEHLTEAVLELNSKRN